MSLKINDSSIRPDYQNAKIDISQKNEPFFCLKITNVAIATIAGTVSGIALSLIFGPLLGIAFGCILTTLVCASLDCLINYKNSHKSYQKQLSDLNNSVKTDEKEELMSPCPNKIEQELNHNISTSSTHLQEHSSSSMKEQTLVILEDGARIKKECDQKLEKIKLMLQQKK